MFMASTLAPLIAMAALTFVLMFGMVLTRRRAVLDKKTNPKDLLVRGGKNPWPPQAAQFSDAYQNSLELPILFYAVFILAIIAGTIDNIFLVLAWLFVLCRVAQAYIHTTSNARKYRSLAFRAGALVLLATWILFSVRLFSE